MQRFGQPAASFHFSVALSGAPGESSFQEVSGLKAEWTVEEVAEGGQNRFVHKLPSRTRYSPLVLKRGVVPGDSKLADWLTASFRSSLTSRRVQPKNIVVLLLDGKARPVVKWWVAGAYPLRWDHSTLKSGESDLLIETIELSYSFFERTTMARSDNAA
jgi:phage tail-like protein